MITLFRMMVVKYIKTRWECAFWMEFNKQANELVKHPENIEKKILPYLVDAIRKASEMEKLYTIPDELLIKGHKND